MFFNSTQHCSMNSRAIFTSSGFGGFAASFVSETPFPFTYTKASPFARERKNNVKSDPCKSQCLPYLPGAWLGGDDSGRDFCCVDCLGVRFEIHNYVGGKRDHADEEKNSLSHIEGIDS